MSEEEIEALITPMLEKLGEHFDAVQLLFSWNEEGKTRSVSRGNGNWYARQGMAHEFINADIAQEHAKQLADQINPE